MKLGKIIAITFLVIAFVGFADATFLTWKHYVGIVPPCFVATGCETVLTSTWNKIAGIPVSLLGALYYVFLGILATYYLATKKEGVVTIAAWSTFAGLFASLWFVSLQIFIIKHICFYCMISATTSLLLFVTGSIYIFKKPKIQIVPKETLSS